MEDISPYARLDVTRVYPIPFVELIAGGLLLVGTQTRGALLAIAATIVLITLGGLVRDPLHDVPIQLLPRIGLLLYLLAMPESGDRWSLDHWLQRRRSRSKRNQSSGFCTGANRRISVILVVGSCPTRGTASERGRSWASDAPRQPVELHQQRSDVCAGPQANEAPTSKTGEG